MRIIPADRALMLGRVVIRAFIEEIDFLAQRKITVRKPGRHPEHVMVRVAENDAHPLPKAWRAAPDVDCDIKYLAARHTHELALGLLNLKMQSAQRMPSRMAVIVLHEGHGDAGGAKFLRLPGLKEKTPRIAEHTRLDQYDFGKPGRLKFHYSRSRRRASR